MFRAILGGVVGYIVMGVVVFATFTVLYLVLKADGSFKEGSWDPSMMWIVATVVLGFIAAIIGGVVCAKIAMAGSKAPMVLAAFALVFGLLLAVLAMVAKKDPDKPARTSDVGMLDAMNNAEQPLYVAFLNPFIGAVGVIVGARMVRKEPKAEA